MTLRIIVSISAARNLEMTQLDIKTTFLYGTLDVELYLEQPEGYIFTVNESSVIKDVHLWLETSLESVKRKI